MSKRAASNEPLNVQLPVIQLALDKILVDESKNLRRFAPDAKEIEKLANSIRDNGMISPVLVRPLSEPVEGCTHVLVAGYQRLKAIAHLNESGHHINEVSASLKEIPEGEDGTQEEKDVVQARKFKILNLKENLDRSEISYIDAAYAIKELQDSGMTNTDIAKEFSKSGAWVGYVVKMLGLRAEIQKKIHSGVINFRLAKTLPELVEEEQDQRIAELEGGETGSQVAKRAKAGKKRKNKRGRKGQEDAVDNKNISSKQAILQLEELVAGLKEEPEEKRDKAEEAAVEYAVGLYKDVVKFLSGGIGVKALHNRVMKAV